MSTRGVMVTVSETILQDIAALKQQQADLRRSVDEGNRNTQQAVASVNGRLDGVTDLLQTVARIAERQEAQGSGLNRAFSEIRAVKEHADGRIDETENWQEVHQRENAAVERKLSTWHGIAIGISVAAALVVSLLGWAGNEVLTDVRNDVREGVREGRDTNKRDDERLDRLERIEAQYHGGT